MASLASPDTNSTVYENSLVVYQRRASTFAESSLVDENT